MPVILLIIGLALGAGTLLGIKQIGFLGSTCFYIGEFDSLRVKCIAPGIYYGLIGISAILVAVSLLTLLLRAQSSHK